MDQLLKHETALVCNSLFGMDKHVVEPNTIIIVIRVGVFTLADKGKEKEPCHLIIAEQGC